MPAPAANAKSIAFGNWSYVYAIRRVLGIGIKRLGELYSTNGQVGFAGSHRVDGRVTIADAARALQHSAT